jgi:hypothetical protein
MAEKQVSVQFFNHTARPIHIGGLGMLTPSGQVAMPDNVKTAGRLQVATTMSDDQIIKWRNGGLISWSPIKDAKVNDAIKMGKAAPIFSEPPSEEDVQPLDRSVDRSAEDKDAEEEKPAEKKPEPKADSKPKAEEKKDEVKPKKDGKK